MDKRAERVLSRMSASSNLLDPAACTSRWLATAAQGFCGKTDLGANCRVDDKGSWELSGAEASSWEAAAAACTSRCSACERCKHVSISLKFKDCSWFFSDRCDLQFSVPSFRSAAGCGRDTPAPVWHHRVRNASREDSQRWFWGRQRWRERARHRRALPRAASAAAAARTVDHAIVTTIERVSFAEAHADLQAFYSSGGGGESFRVHIDDTCGMPIDWRSTWNASSQWGIFGNRHWATKYGAAGFLPHMIEQSPFFTSDWRAASASVVVLFARHYAGGAAITQQQCLRRLEQRSPAFRATGGARHFFIFTDSRGPCCIDGSYKDVDFLRHRIIGPHAEPPSDEGFSFRRGVAKGPPLRCFDERKDIGIPTPNIHFPRTPFARPLGRGADPAHDAIAGAAPPPQEAPQPEPPPARDLLIFYAGWNYDERMRLVKALSTDPDPEVLVRRQINASEFKRGMLRARFCPICGGFSQWTPRLAEALYYGCVPVLFSRHLQPPFASILDWSTFSVRPNPDEIDASLAYPSKLKAELRALDYDSLARGVMAARGALQYHLGRFTGRDMLPLLVFQMSQRLATPIELPNNTFSLANDVEADRDYDAGLDSSDRDEKTLAAHAVAAHAELSVEGQRWQCSTFDGSLCPCIRWDAQKDGALREAVAAAGRTTATVSPPPWPARTVLASAKAGPLWARVGGLLKRNPVFREDRDQRFVVRFTAALRSHFQFLERSGS